MTRPRSLAREAALKALYLLDQRPDAPWAEVEAILSEDLPQEPSREFARELIRGTRAHLATIDAEVGAVAHNWSLARMAVIDRNVLRLGAYELLHQTEGVPAAVAIDEAVTIAKKFSTRESGAFVNGILDKIHQRHQAAAPREAAAPAPVVEEDAP